MGTALVLGGLGIIGRNLIHYLEKKPEWKVKSISRRSPDFETTAEFTKADLLNKDDLLKHATWLSDVTHIFYAAYQEHADPVNQSHYNLSMLRNIVEAVDKASNSFRHITFIQGGKAYGAHLGKYKTPAREADPRHFPPNFYYDQEDYLRDVCSHRPFSWTAMRPDFMLGFALGNPMNLINIIGVYASLCKEFKVPFRYTGNDRAYHALVNGTDAHVLAKAMEWAATHEECYGEIFNITNGDIFRWSEVFPAIAEKFNLDYAPPLTMSLSTMMSDKKKKWEEMTKKYNFFPVNFEDFANWNFGDFIFNVSDDAFFDVNKARRFGFHEMNLNSTENIIHHIEELRGRNVIHL